MASGPLSPVLLVMGWAAFCGVSSAESQDSTGTNIIVRPDRLAEGSLCWIWLRSPPGSRLVGGEAAGEPLHLEPDGQDTLKSLVGVPVEAGDSFRVTLYLERSDRTDTIVTALPVQPGQYANEVLAVAPAFVRPDSAAAARIQNEIAQSREVSRLSQARPRLWRGPFRLPRASRITSRVGKARVLNREVQSPQQGTDFARAIGAPVRAAGAGMVALVADFYLAGRAVYLDHGGGIVTAYFHLIRADVRQGQRVVAGQRIGAVGRSGRVTGPHLHLVARYGAVSVDPMTLLTLDSAAQSSRKPVSAPPATTSGRSTAPPTLGSDSIRSN